MKKLLSLFLASVMVFTSSVTAFAEKSPIAQENEKATEDEVLVAEPDRKAYSYYYDYYSSDYCITYDLYVYDDGSTYLYIDGYDGSNNLIEVPSSLMGYAITDVDIYYCTSNTVSVYLPSTLNSFYISSSLNVTEVTVSAGNSYYKAISGVVYSKDGTSLEYYPTCKTATSYTILDGCTTVNNSFNNDYIESVTIPASVTYVSSSAFANAYYLENIYVNSDNSYYKSVDGVLLSADGKNLIKFPRGRAGSYTIPSTVTTIDRWAFPYPKLTSLTISANVTSISEEAIDNTIESISVASGNSYFKTVNGVLYSKDGTRLILCPRDNTITTLAIPSGVTEIDKYAFYNCYNLVEVTFPSTLTSIDDYTFYYCYALTKITIPASITYINNWAFYNCESLAYIYYGGTEAQWDALLEDGYTYYSIEDATVYYNMSAPTNVKAVAGDKNIKISWSAVSGATSYRVQRYSSSGWTSVAYPTTNSYINTGLSNGTTYKYRVLAYVGGSWSNPSAVVSAKPFNTTPSAIKAVPKNKKVTVSWSKVAGATKYRLQRTTGSSWTTIVYPTATSYTDTSVTNNTTYKYRVLACVNGYWSTATSAVSAKPVSSKPLNFKAVASNKKVTLSWSAVTGATKYRLQRTTGSTWTTIAYPTSRSYADTSVTNNTTYKYRVLAYVNGEWGEASAVASAKPFNVIPENLKAVGSNKKVTLSWTAVSGAVKYRIQRTTGSTWTTVAYPTTASYTDTSVSNGVTYKYRVLAYLNGAWGTPSSVVSVVPGDYAPKNVKATIGTKKIIVSWSAVSGATKYRVQRNTGLGWTTVDYPTGTDYVDSNITYGTYKYRVLAYVNGAWSECSQVVSVEYSTGGGTIVG